MGTNVYWHNKDGDDHVGKFSMGWKFLAYQPTLNKLQNGIGDFTITLLQQENTKNYLVNEYGEKLSVKEFIRMIKAYNKNAKRQRIDPNNITLWVNKLYDSTTDEFS